MNTAKPISTISWNTEGFLRSKLAELTKAKRIDFWSFIYHLPEDDEGGKKPHFHVYLEPSKRTQTADLKDEFKEFDPTHPDKPLGCLTFKSSHFSDWYLYALHDRSYLAAKSQSRRHHYSPEDLQSMDEDELHERVYQIDMSDITPIKRLRAFQEAGKSFNEAVATGVVPIPQIGQYQTAWLCLMQDQTDRADRSPHDNVPDVDQSTGEVLRAD